MKKLMLFAGAGLLAISAIADEGKGGGTEKTVKGEILDVTCYADHGGSGAEHAACARKCIGMGLPVGIKGEDGKVYLVVGEHKPINQELEKEAGKTVTLKGKVVSRDGVTLLENAEMVK